jgi:hypothetical protein
MGDPSLQVGGAFSYGKGIYVSEDSPRNTQLWSVTQSGSAVHEDHFDILRDLQSWFGRSFSQPGCPLACFRPFLLLCAL